MFFRKTMAAVLTFSLVLGWSPTSYRAYADSPALDENSSAKISEQNNLTGGGSSERSDAQASPVFDFQAAVGFAAADAALCSYPDDELDISLLTNLGDQAVDSDANIAPLDDIQEESAPHDEAVQSDAATNDEAASGQDAAVSGEASDAQQDAAAIEGAEVLQQGDGEAGNVLLADRAAVDALGGRDFKGQVVKEINGTQYILIGNEQQLRAIGSGAKVHTAAYQAKLKGVHWEVDKDENGDPIMLYGGDADLLASQNGKQDFVFSEIQENHGALTGRCGVNQITGEIDPNMDVDSGVATYAADANYIIFRDIDLGGVAWQPLMFSGAMLGAKSDAPGTAGSLWGCISADGKGITDVTKVANPVIGNVSVIQSGRLSVGEQMGVGFFGTISADHDDNDMFARPGTATVSNITLKGVKVDNGFTEAYVDQSLVSALAGLLGDLVGGLLGLLLGPLLALLGVPDLPKLVSNLLHIRAADPTSLATGAFVGRVVGPVEISGCEVSDVSVKSINAYTGGFVGYVQGETLYDGISGLADGLVKLLAGLLNVIPGVGLDDVITLLLDSNVIKAGQLIPIDYMNPVISACGVKDFAANEMATAVDKDYAGGFVGAMVGTIAQDCFVESANAYAVKSRLYAGGFAGLMRNDVMKGALSKLLGELVRVAQPQSVAVGCAVRSGVAVTAECYAGGFAGAMANSYAVDDSVEGAVNVSATGHEWIIENVHKVKAIAGGFAGAATVGWVTDLGRGENKDSDLLAGVNGLLNGLLTSNPEAAQDLLSLVGVEESKLLGVQMSGDFTVHSANDCAGGIVGRGDGVVIAAADQLHLNDIKFWSQGTVTHPASGRAVVLKGLRSVEAVQSCAGGIAGLLGTASVGGIINNTVGLGGYLAFELSDVTVEGVPDGAAVVAGDAYAGGAVANATGGSCINVHIGNIGSVRAGTRAGGFAGGMGPGSLAGGSGLDLLGLGAVSIKGLLAVGEGVNVTADNCSVAGHANGFAVEAIADVAPDAGVSAALAGGFVADNRSGQLSNCNVVGLHRVFADVDNGAAGGFVGNSETGGLADVADDAAILKLGSIAGLLDAVPYLIPKYSDCNVTYAGDATVAADEAGGFAGVFRSGVVEGMPADDADADQWTVNNLKSVEGGSYAGGFAGFLTSGALAAAADGGGGLSILGGIKGLKVDLSNLLSLIDAYVATVSDAGVNSPEGFTVRASRIDALDANSGAAGGFAGYASGAQISNCDVNKVAHTKIVDPSDLEAYAIDAYYDPAARWAIDGLRYAGGYAGRLDIGSTASVGEGLGILGSAINLKDVLSALNVMVSTVEHSDVCGMPGGYAVRATTANGEEGYAGGFAGRITGAHIQDSSAHSFSHVVGRIAAGGYAGGMEPGSAAGVLGGGESSVLKKLVNIDSLANLVEDFVPTVRNSSTDCVPCGGVVRAQAASDGATMRGMAGGYAGYNEGGQIWGKDTRDWKAAAYAGPTRTAFADRMRSVFGTEVSGGYTGYMRPADTADTGSLSLLFGLIKVDTLASALSVVYPTQRQTRVTGPLSGVDMDTWNKWVDFVGVNGGFGADLAQGGKVSSQGELDAKIADYVYGFNVVAGRSAYSIAANECDGGVAGGYVGIMRSGVVSDGAANDAKLVRGMRAAGGYAGFMESGGAANLGSVSILGLNLNVGQLVSAAEVFVPSIQGSSSTVGYREGMTVQALGTGVAADDVKHDLGHAGGYVGYAEGAQIWGDTQGATGCNVGNLRLVKGSNTVGGYAGTAAPGSATDANTNASNGLLQGILDTVIKQPSEVANVLEATMTTIRGASVTPADEAWGFVVDGSCQQAGATEFAAAAGGFVGSCESAVLGSKKGESKLTVAGLRGVTGGKNAGGFVGLADVGSAADVGGTDAGTNKTSILSLIGLGNASVLDAFRSYVYHADVTGVADGAQVRANKADTVGTMASLRYFGNAGGFAGSLLNGSVKDCTVRGLSAVTAPSYAGGFAGYMGKNSTVDVDEATAGVKGVFDLLKLQAGALDVWGSHADRCRVEGIASGFTVTSGGEVKQPIVEQGNNAAQNIAGGFVGMGDLSKIDGCEVTNLGIVRSDQVSGGFIGQTDKSFIVETQLDSVVVELLLVIVDQLVKALYVADLENLGVIDLSGFVIPGLGDLLGLKILSDGDLLYVNLLGLRIGVALAKGDPNDPTQSDAAIVTIGDSTIKLPCNKDGLIKGEDTRANLEITLIKGNRTTVTNSMVTGSRAGYDVFGGGATQDVDGAAVEGGLPGNENHRPDNAGYAGGFVGHNKEGLFEHNELVYCDVVRGTEQLVGPFSGMTNLQSVYFDEKQGGKGKKAIEGQDNEGRYNLYSIYRDMNAALGQAVAQGKGQFSTAQQDTASGEDYNRYKVQHYEKISTFDDLKGAVMQGGGVAPVAMDAYVSPAKAVLMDDAINTPVEGGITPEPGDGQDPCLAQVEITLRKVWKDNANAGGTRPSEVVFKLKRTYVNAAGEVVEDATFGTNGVLDVTLTAADASEWTETWRKVLTGLPVAFEDTAVDPPAVRYYTYSVAEVLIGGYDATTDYSYTVANDGTGYVITVTNTLPLPEAGGMGVWPLVVLALVLMAGGALWYRRRRAAQAACEAFGFRAVAQGVVVPGGASGEPVVLNLPRI